jgi:benzodiazapine receptor
MKKFFQVLISILLCQGAGIIGSAFTFSSIPNWYAHLNKASFNPPNWVFGPVWLTLYTLMGIAAFLIWEKRKTNKQTKIALNMFIFQLILNSLWSIVFFGAHQIFFGLAIIVVLWLAILATIVKFRPISKTAAFLLLPYLLWVSVATSLNYFVFILNP